MSLTCYLHESCGKYVKGICPFPDFCIKKFKIDSLFDEALISDIQRKHINLRIDADGTDKAQFMTLKSIEDNIESFVNEGKNLYLYSYNCGNGKSSWMLRLAQSYINAIWHKSEIKPKVLFISVPKFFIMLKDNISNKNEYISHIKKHVLDCDLVLWDDIGTKVGTQFEIDNLLNIIDNRVVNGKSNIYTSNMDPAQLEECVGSRLYSRIVNLSTNIELRGMDKRGL